MAQLTLEAAARRELALEAARDHLLSLQDEAAGGAASCRRTSRWTPRTCCCASSSASAATTRPSAPPRGSAPSSAPTAPGRTSTRDRATCRRRSRPTGRCGWPATTRRTSTCGSPPSSCASTAGWRRRAVFTHLWLALFGLWSWDRVPALPPEIVLLPARVPAQRLRLRLLGAADDRRPLAGQSAPAGASPAASACDELRGATQRGVARAPGARAARPVGSPGPRRCASTNATRSRPLRRLACARAESWIVRRQEADGSWGGIQPPWVYSLIALHLAGYPLDHPVMRRGLEGIEGFMVEDRDDSSRRRRAAGREPAPGSVPVARLGHGAGDGRAQRRRAGGRSPGDGAGGALAARRGGDGPAATGRSMRPASLPAAGRSSSPTSTTPTSMTRPRSCWRWSAPSWGPSALRRRGARDAGAGVGRGDAELRRRLGRVRCRQHAFAGARAAVPGLRRGDRRAERRRHGARGRDARRARARRLAGGAARACAGCSTTRSATAPGSGAGVSTTSTARAPRCPGLVAAGVDPAQRADPPRRAWLEATRTTTAAGARTRAPTTIRAGSAAGPSTASQTAWALLALHAAGERSAALARGVAWLAGTQRPDGELGRAPVHGHRLPVRLLHQLPPLQADLPDHGARSLPGERLGRRAGGRSRAGCPRARGDAAWRARRFASPDRRGGDGEGGGRELPGREPAAAARDARAPARASTASPGWSTSSATAPPGDRLAALDWL